VSVLPPIRDSGIDTCAIVIYSQGKVARISELYLQSTCPGMSTCVADGFVTDAENLIADDGISRALTGPRQSQLIDCRIA
jgi:hypothetical protein